MRVSSIPMNLTPATAFEIKLPEAMKNNMRVSFYKEGDTFQNDLKMKARALKIDVFQLYTNLLFYKVYEARTKFISERQEATKWVEYYAAVARGVSPEDAKRVLGLADEPKEVTHVNPAKADEPKEADEPKGSNR